MENILEIKDLKMDLMSTRGIVHTVRGVKMSVRNGEIHGIVGESGCGKSMLVKSVMRLHDEKRSRYFGSVLLNGQEVLEISKKEIQKLRGKEVSMIFQDPMNSLDPIMKVGKQIGEMLRKKEGMSKKQARERAKKLLEQVGLEPVEERIDQYPFEMSGGMMQRVMIAMAMACRPKLLIADEPTTALDVTIQKQILELIKRLRDKYGMACMIVTHNLGVVAEICDTVSVMYAGQVVETASVQDLFAHPMHPYTKALMASSPSKSNRGEKMVTIPGEPPKLYLELKGCAFASRCPYATEYCKTHTPALQEVRKGQQAACFEIAEAKKARNEVAYGIRKRNCD